MQLRAVLTVRCCTTVDNTITDTAHAATNYVESSFQLQHRHRSLSLCCSRNVASADIVCCPADNKTLSTFGKEQNALLPSAAVVNSTTAAASPAAAPLKSPSESGVQGLTDSDGGE